MSLCPIPHMSLNAESVGATSQNLRLRFNPVRAVGWIVALVPTAVALVFGRNLHPWIWMWAIAFALFIGAKWVTIQGFLRSGKSAGLDRLLMFGLLWPGMNVQAFCTTRPVPAPTG